MNFYSGFKNSLTSHIGEIQIKSGQGMQFECLTPESSFIGTKAFFGTYGEKECFLNIVRVTLADSHLFKLL